LEIIKLNEIKYVSIAATKPDIGITFSFFLRSLLLSYHFPKKISVF